MLCGARNSVSNFFLTGANASRCAGRKLSLLPPAMPPHEEEPVLSGRFNRLGLASGKRCDTKRLDKAGAGLGADGAEN